jgi:Adaptor complexes medium subunit family
MFEYALKYVSMATAWCQCCRLFESHLVVMKWLAQLIGARFSDAYRLTLGPVSVDFEISGFVCSNVQIRGLQVYNRDTSYTPKKWIRYITTADSYVIKLF